MRRLQEASNEAIRSGMFKLSREGLMGYGMKATQFGPFYLPFESSDAEPAGPRGRTPRIEIPPRERKSWHLLGFLADFAAPLDPLPDSACIAGTEGIDLLFHRGERSLPPSE
jgi:hypothetical protein